MASKIDSLEETVKPVNDKPPDNVENQFGEASSIDKVTLNNTIISMRSTVKKSKIRILAKVIRHIKQLKSKINEKTINMEKNKRKFANLLEEMKIIKALKPDTVSRFVLGNTFTFVELNNKGFQSTEARALARFSDENLLQDRVKKFRAEHSDWKSLAAFVQTQSSGRHIKKKKKNKSNKIKKEETKTNIKAKQIMVSTFLHGKVNNMNSDKEALNSESDISASHVTNAKSSQKQKGMISNKNEEPICKDLHLQPIDSEIHSNQEKSDLDFCSETDPPNLNKEIQNSKQSHKTPNTKSTVIKLKNSDKEPSVEKQQAENSSQNAAKMVVKKINLHNFEDDISIDAEPATENSKEKLFRNDNNQSKESEFFFVSDQESSVKVPEEENKLEKVDQKNDDEPEFTVSGNHSMFLSLSGSDVQSFRGGSGRRGRMNSHSPYSEFRRQKPNSQGHQNPGYRNNFVQGRFSNRGRGKPSTYPLTKTFKESKDTPSKNTPKQKLSDKSNFSDEKLHPSWEASRKRKEQAASISVFQGKKVKFDD